MKPWMILTALTALLVLLGIWLVWSQSPDIETPAEPEEEVAAVEAVPAPAKVPRRPVSASAPGPEPALNQAEVLRVLEEVAKNQQALEDWDQQLAQACKSLVRGRKYEEAQQCYHLRLARNPDDADAYKDRGILHARMGKRVESYWDYQKYLELAPDGKYAPQIRNIVERYDEWASGADAPKRDEYDYREEVADLAKSLYEEAYILKNRNPKEALRKLDQALRLLKVLPKEYQAYLGKAERLIKRIESGPEEPRYQPPRPEDF